MTKVLVTGASGFIGLHLVKALQAAGHDLTCLVRPSSSVASLEAAGVRLVRGDITDGPSLRGAVAGQDVVYQLAGCLRALHPKQLYRVNEEGVRNLAQACAEQPTPPVLVTVSSLAAVGPAVEDQPRREGDPPAPVSHYGRSKLAGERAARPLAGQVPITIVRPPVVFGEGDPAMRAVFSMIARFSLHLVPGLHPHRFSVIHADDLVNLMILAAGRGSRLEPPGQDGNGDGDATDGSSQGIYFACCEENPTFAELGRLIGAAVGRAARPGRAHGQPAGLDDRRHERGDGTPPASSLLLQLRQGPRGNGWLLDLFPQGGHRGVGVCRGCPAVGAAPPDGPLVPRARLVVDGSVSSQEFFLPKDRPFACGFESRADRRRLPVRRVRLP